MHLCFLSPACLPLGLLHPPGEAPGAKKLWNLRRALPAAQSCSRFLSRERRELQGCRAEAALPSHPPPTAAAFARLRGRWSPWARRAHENLPLPRRSRCSPQPQPADDASRVAELFLLSKRIFKGQGQFPGGEKVPRKQKGVLSCPWLWKGAGNRFSCKG